jgi:hypothetical protein
MKLGHNYIGTEHILFALIVEQTGIAARALASLGVTYERVNVELIGVLTQAAGAESTGWVGRTGPSEVPSPGPGCPSCKVTLLDKIAYRIVDAPEDGGPGHRKVCIVYCEACGHTLLSRFEGEAE